MIFPNFDTHRSYEDTQLATVSLLSPVKINGVTGFTIEDTLSQYGNIIVFSSSALHVHLI